MTKQKIRESKKGVFLIIGLIHLNLYLLIAAVFPGINIALFVNSLIIILSLYLTGQSAIDTVQTFTNSNNTDSSIKKVEEVVTHNENIDEHIIYEEQSNFPRPYSQNASGNE